MRKIILAVAFLMVFITNAFCADVWKFKAVEISKPSLISISVTFTLLLNGTNYVTDTIAFMASELEGKTLVQRKQYIGAKIKEKCAVYINTYNMADKLDQLVGQEFDAQ